MGIASASSYRADGTGNRAMVPGWCGGFSAENVYAVSISLSRYRVVSSATGWTTAPPKSSSSPVTKAIVVGTPEDGLDGYDFHVASVVGLPESLFDHSPVLRTA